MVLEEYGDYQCPPCGMLYPELKQIEHEYGNQVRFVFRHFPLTKIHKNAMIAAQAAEAAGNQDKFSQMHDRLYGTQNAWKDLADARPTFIGYARELGLNLERFTRDMDSTAVEQRIAADMQRGSGVGVTGTPTVFIEGQMLRYEATTPDGPEAGHKLHASAEGRRSVTNVIFLAALGESTSARAKLTSRTSAT